MHNIESCINPEVATGQTKLAALDKVAYGQRFDVSKRTVDNWLTMGLPHLKLSERAVRIPLEEGDRWVRERFLTQHLKAKQTA